MSFDPLVTAELTQHAASCARLACIPSIADPARTLSFPITLILLGTLLVVTGLGGRCQAGIGQGQRRPWQQMTLYAAAFAALWTVLTVLHRLVWGLPAFAGSGPVLTVAGPKTIPPLPNMIEAVVATALPVFIAAAMAFVFLREIGPRLSARAFAALAAALFILVTLYQTQAEYRTLEGQTLPASPLAQELATMAKPYGLAAEQLRTDPFAVIGSNAVAYSIIKPRITYGYGLFSRAMDTYNGKHLVPRLTDRQIKALTGHELAHIALNHSHKRVLLELLLGGLLIGSAVFAVALAAQRWRLRWRISGPADPAMLAGYGAAVLAANLVLGFTLNAQSRAQELEADRMGMTISGDPAGFAAALIRINTGYELDYRGKLSQLLASHPEPATRIAVLSRMVATERSRQEVGETAVRR